MADGLFSIELSRRVVQKSWWLMAVRIKGRGRNGKWLVDVTGHQIAIKENFC